jgi:hypothetical protein
MHKQFMYTAQGKLVFQEKQLQTKRNNDVSIEHFNQISISTNGRCGPGEGGNQQCPENSCCSIFGWCGGPGSEHCTTYKSTDPNFHGLVITESKNARCGPQNGNTRCPENQCCSIYGWCGGFGSDHCGWAKDKDIRFHGPSVIKETTNGRCGPLNGNQKCLDNQCCSKDGFCGNFGSEQCTPDKLSTSQYHGDVIATSTNGKCGLQNNKTKCPEDQCCSKNGTCSAIGTVGCGVDKDPSPRFHGPPIPISINNKCGTQNGNKCEDNKYCSDAGDCIPPWSHRITKRNEGQFINSSNKKYHGYMLDISSDGQCGPINGKRCPNKWCCSQSGSCTQYCTVNKHTDPRFHGM